MSANDLHASVGDKPMLRWLSLGLPAGEDHAVMGPNGAVMVTIGTLR